MNYTKEKVEAFLKDQVHCDAKVLAADLIAWREIAERLHKAHLKVPCQEGTCATCDARRAAMRAYEEAANATGAGEMKPQRMKDDGVFDTITQDVALPCPFCGSKADERHGGFVCTNEYCPAACGSLQILVSRPAKLRQWNRRQRMTP